MDRPRSFKALEVWQVSMDMVGHVYECTKRMPRSEFDLRRQMRRAGVSIPTNVAEGYRRRRRLAYQNHVSIALGSQAELWTELEVSFRNCLLNRAECERLVELVDRVGAMLHRLYGSLDP